MIGLSNCRRETHIFEGSPFTEAAAQTLPVRFICWKTWPQILVPGGQMLLFPCGAPIPFPGAVCRHLCSVTRQLSSGVFLARNFHASLQTQLCRLEFPQHEERTAVSGLQKLPLPSLGAFLSLSRACFVEGLRFPPRW